MTYIRTAPAPSHIRPEEIMAAVLAVCGTDISAVCGNNRHGETVAARTIFCVLCRELTVLSYTDIQRFLSRPNHSTCVTAVGRYRREPERYRGRLETARAMAVGARDRRDYGDLKARVFA